MYLLSKVTTPNQLGLAFILIGKTSDKIQGGLLEAICLCRSVLMAYFIKYGHITPERGQQAGSNASWSYLIQSSLGIAAELLEKLCEGTELS